MTDLPDPVAPPRPGELTFEVNRRLVDEVVVVSEAQIIAANRLGRGRLAALPEPWRPRDEHAAYAIQDALHGILSGQGLGDQAGREDAL